MHETIILEKPGDDFRHDRCQQESVTECAVHPNDTRIAITFDDHARHVVSERRTHAGRHLLDLCLSERRVQRVGKP